MKEYKLQQTILVVEVPESAYDLQVSSRWGNQLIWNDDNEDFSQKIDLPEKGFTILGKAFDLTEEEAKKILPSREYYEHELGYYDEYEIYGTALKTNNPLQSWRSFLSTHSIKENNLILIKE